MMWLGSQNPKIFFKGRSISSSPGIRDTSSPRCSHLRFQMKDQRRSKRGAPDELMMRWSWWEMVSWKWAMEKLEKNMVCWNYPKHPKLCRWRNVLCKSPLFSITTLTWTLPFQSCTFSRHWSCVTFASVHADRSYISHGYSELGTRAAHWKVWPSG